MSVPEPVLKDILKYGKYYFPATSHYSYSCSVICDRCNKTNLPACIGCTLGDKTYDLCMNCVDGLTKDNKVPIIDDLPSGVVTLMMADRFDVQNQRDGGMVTKMMSNRFKNPPLTRMSSDKFMTL